MTTFHLTVVTPDGCAFDGQAERVVCRAIDGDLAILAKHGDYCTALGMGEAHIVDADGQRRRAACMGGMLTVLNGDVHLVATTWEWAEEIDQARAEASKQANEDARFVLPNACETKMVVTMNARSLQNFFHLRCCSRAQWEIRQLAEEMFRLVYPVAPHIFAKAGPACVSGPCPEGKMCCGRTAEVRAKYEAIKQEAGV